MVRPGVIEVDCLFHQPEPQDPGVEVEVDTRMSGDGGDVVNSRDLLMAQIDILFSASLRRVLI